MRPPHIFFYEIDVKKNEFRKKRKELEQYAKKKLKYFSLYRTRHGYHIIGYPYSEKVFRQFKRRFPSDYLNIKKFRPRWGKKYPFVLRISEKFNLQTGRVVSPKPKFISGDFFLLNVQKYKVVYIAK